MGTHLLAHEDIVVAARYMVEPRAFDGSPFAADELAAMERYVDLARELPKCRYFAEGERHMRATVDQGVTTITEMTMPDAGATRDMLAILRQLFSDRERGGFAPVIAILRAHAAQGTEQGRALLDALERYERAKHGALDSWDARPGGRDTSPQPPLNVFLDWMYGEYLHSDADKAAQIKKHNEYGRLYEWQFHWIAERLCTLFVRFSHVVGAALDLQQPAII